MKEKRTQVDFKELAGKKIVEVSGKVYDEEIIFKCTDGPSI